MKASAVSRILAKTLTRSKTEATTIRGYSTTSAGFVVKQYLDGVGVFYTTGNWDSQSDFSKMQQRKNEMIETIKQTLVQNGFVLSKEAEFVFVIGKIEGDQK
jgi:mannitol/fructose-specific phosphotransferase system IIA component